ncbi:Uncharacterized protein SCF082_LOCUS22061 [Durusdinium trenchii]|uniref:Uncharacterized protein n=1 Tax=Durusdinium trenchii TaxID=1381693 RepID=A0ABP0LG24_9DINO
MKKTSRRKAVPYNTYVQRERQQRFYERHKTHARFKRLQRHEERQGLGEPALLQRVLSEGADQVDADYERRLELTGLGAGKPVAKAEAAPEAAKKRRKRRRIEAASQPTTEPGSWKPKAKVAAKAKVPSRYQRELKAYEEAQAAKAAAEKQREEDKRERNRKKKQTAKERAMTGKLLAKRNPKGQPSMRNLIEMVTSKLEATTASSSTQAKSARGFGRRPRR